ncbi:hypothetical protein R5H30_04870 [Sulfitobacter sp. D35]|uniref:hypothetical protein n=1 Tax=Sulfitobacter sp. D35 TaxID=3083252 RepID=UPI00296FCD61|nr:hypothetical protein [Sulfitobacter sp. D35]MDW4497304.1 hypothetical protein [Sulfitobacter sp. D35]
MHYATVTTNDVDPKEPLVFLIDLQGQGGSRRFVGTSTSGARLPQVGFPWIVSRLLDRAVDDPDWAGRCDWVHFKMLEAWIFGRSINLTLLENAPRDRLPDRRREFAEAHDAGLDGVSPDPGLLAQSLGDLCRRALQTVLDAEDGAEERRTSPQRWWAAVQAHAEAEGLSDEDAEADLRKRVG